MRCLAQESLGANVGGVGVGGGGGGGEGGGGGGGPPLGVDQTFSLNRLSSLEGAISRAGEHSQLLSLHHI